MDCKIQPGDVFGTRNPMALGRAVNVIQRIWARDSQSKYSHSGIIIDEDGTTFESLWTLKRQILWQAYPGTEMIIARCTEAPPRRVDSAIKRLLLEHEGQWYPAWRLLLHVIPPLAKICLSNRPVCSELTAKFLWYAGARHGQWASTNPDTLADEWRRWKGFDVIFEGILPQRA